MGDVNQGTHERVFAADGFSLARGQGMKPDIDFDPPTPVEAALARKRFVWWAVALTLVLAALYYLIFVNQYVVAFKDDLDHFKHGSIGSEPGNGLP